MRLANFCGDESAIEHIFLSIGPGLYPGLFPKSYHTSTDTLTTCSKRCIGHPWAFPGPSRRGRLFAPPEFLLPASQPGGGHKGGIEQYIGRVFALVVGGEKGYRERG